jgi:hypothetical protein
VLSGSVLCGGQTDGYQSVSMSLSGHQTGFQSVPRVIERKRKSPSRLRRDALRWQVWKSRCTIKSAGVKAQTEVDVCTVGVGT